MSLQLGPWTLERGDLMPSKLESRTNQKLSEADDGTVGVSTPHVSVRYHNLRLQLSDDEARNVLGWIETGIRFAEVPFVYTGHNGDTHIVRVWGKKAKPTRVAYNMLILELQLREERPL